MTKYCSKCGEKLNDDTASYCPTCGSQINEDIKVEKKQHHHHYGINRHYNNTYWSNRICN